MDILTKLILINPLTSKFFSYFSVFNYFVQCFKFFLVFSLSKSFWFWSAIKHFWCFGFSHQHWTQKQKAVFRWFIRRLFTLWHYCKLSCIPGFFLNELIKNIQKNLLIIVCLFYASSALDSIYIVCWFVHIKTSLSLHNETKLIKVCDLFRLLLNSVYKHFVEFFYAHVHQGNWSIIFLFNCLIRFWYHAVVGCKECVSLKAFLLLLSCRVVSRALVLVIFQRVELIIESVQSWIPI